MTTGDVLMLKAPHIYVLQKMIVTVNTELIKPAEGKPNYEKASTMKFKTLRPQHGTK